VVRTPEDDLLSSVSPDGRFLAVTSEVNGNLDVWVRDFASDAFYPVTRAPADDHDPDIAPDGDRVVFASRRSDAKGDLLITSLDPGGEPKRLTGTESSDRQPVFSVDGRRIFFTSSRRIGPERIESIARDGSDRRVESPGPGFDPEPLPDGRHLVYTAPADADRPEPHLVLLRWTDGATTALTRTRGPEGFARVVPAAPLGRETAPAPLRIVFSRFPDDDDGDGHIDADDRASLWEITVPDVDALWSSRDRPEPFPLTDGSDNELFPSPGPFFLFYTQGTVQQDILRIRHDGMFPRYADPEDYFRLARSIEDPRTRWFAYRCALAVAPASGGVAARARLAIASLQQRRGRPDLADVVLESLAERSGPDLPPEVGLARVERLAIRREELAPSAARIASLRAEVDRIDAGFADAPAVRARADLERALIAAWAGEDLAALEHLRSVEVRWRDRPSVAARAALERLRRLQEVSDPEALGAAHASVARRYASVEGTVEAAAERIVEAHVEHALGSTAAGDRDPARTAESVARVLPRYRAPVLQVALRMRLAELRRDLGQLDAAARELEAARDVGPDPYRRARILSRLARLYEALGRPAAAADTWRELRRVGREFPVYAAEARAAITRTNLARARDAERDGRFDDALDAYQRVVDEDPQQYTAHRRRLELIARRGGIDAELERAKARVRADARTPVHHYVLGLAYTWKDDPDLDAARRELTRAIDLNPQLAPAYLARGWVHEMKELERPGVFSSFFSGVGDALTLMFGAGEGDLGSSGWVELAIDDYKLALAANPESADPTFEAQIALNLGNAHYRLGDETNDRTNVELAYARYTDALRLGLDLENERRAYVFWERLGRSAAWREAWADSVTATRRAIGLARRVGLEERLPQLYGNLALAYDRAGEPASARAALSKFESELRERGFDDRMALAFRNEARARLSGPDGHDPATVERALESLRLGARALEEHGVDRGETPSVWRPVVADASRAQFGFDERSERAVNLALREEAHRRLGDVDLADAIRTERTALNREISNQIPKRHLFLNAYFTTLVTLRERVGLVAAEAVELHRNGRIAEAASRLDALRAEARGWVTDADREADRVAHAADLARIDALAVDLVVGTPDGARAASLRSRLAESERLLLRAFAPTSSSTVAEARLALPSPLRLIDTSTTSVVATASVACALSPLAPEARRVRAARARLVWARARLRALALDREPTDRRSPGPSLDAALRRLDDRAAAAEAVVDDLRAAARLGAGAGLGEGALVTAVALAELAAWSEAWGFGPPPRVLRASAARVATALGDLGLAHAVEPAAAIDAAAACLRAPSPVARAAAEARRMSALASALARDEPDRAFGLADALLVARGCRAGLPARAPLRHPEDRPRLERVRGARAELESARTALFRAPTAAHADAVAAAVRAVRGAEAALADAAGVSRFLWLGETAELTDVRAALGPDEGLLVAVPIGDRVELLWTSGSTRTPAVRRARSPASVAELRALLRRAWTEAGTSPDEVRRALLAPLGAPALDTARVAFAGALVGPPLPQRSAPALGFVHVSAPSVVPLLQAELSVGSDEAVVVRADADGDRERSAAGDAASSASWEEGSRVISLSSADAAHLRTGGGGWPPGYAQSVWFDLPFVAQAGSPERSALVVSRQAPADVARLPLDVVEIPAPVAVFGRWRGTTARDAQALWDLDRALLAGGVATGIVVPEAAPGARSTDAERASRLRAVTDAAGAGGFPAAWSTWTASGDSGIGGTVVVGRSGLTARQRSALAAAQLPGAQRAALEAVRAGDYVRAGPRLRRWLQLQKAAGTTRYVPAVYQALVGLYRAQVDPPRPERAAAVQRELIETLEARGATRRELADARVTLAEILSEAGAVDLAEAEFEDAFAQLEAIGTDNDEGLGAAHYRYARHFERHTQLGRAVAELERAIGYFEAAGTYARSSWPEEAERALARSGDLYLNRLSDPARARAAYARELSHARDARERVAIELDLARVARRSGVLDEAARRAREVESEAESRGFALLALEAGIERANAAWFRGDHEDAEALCRTSLTRADAERDRIEADDAIETAAARRRQLDRVELRRVYALSVCGLVAMRRGRFDEAIARLRTARTRAEALDEPAEVATQYNNLGRVYLEFGRFEAAADAFRRARAIDLLRRDVYALAYDDRNLGRALSLLGDPSAEGILRRALAGAREANDRNNEGRSLYALAEHLRARTGRLEEARALHLELLELGAGGALYDRIWAAQYALGCIARAQGRSEAAERWLRRAASEVRRLGAAVGRFTAVGPGRQAPYDALIGLALDAERTADAFAWAEAGRTLEASIELAAPALRDARPEWAPLLEAARTATTVGVARARWRALGAAAPALEAALGPADWGQLRDAAPTGRAMLAPRVLDDEVVTFVVTATSSSVVRVPVQREALEALVSKQRSALDRRAEVSPLLARLAEHLWEPVEPRVRHLEELVVVPWSFLHDVAWAALPTPATGVPLIETHRLVFSAAPSGLAHGPSEAGHAPAIVAWDPPNAGGFAAREAVAIREARPAARVFSGDAATMDAWWAALAGPGAVHVAAHLAVAPDGAEQAAGAPGWGIRLADGVVPVARVLRRRVRAARVLLAICAPEAEAQGEAASRSGFPSGAAVRWAAAFHIAGADAVLAPTGPIDDVAAAVFAKHLYRAGPDVGFADAVRAAHLATRAHWPHPAWWASFGVWVRGPSRGDRATSASDGGPRAVDTGRPPSFLDS
jgi:tetratricopeptide (TPR) repeat protein